VTYWAEPTRPEYGGFWIRFVGYLIDSVLVGIVTGVLTLLAQGEVLILLLGTIVGIGYYVGFNAYGGTLGKRAVGLRRGANDACDAPLEHRARGRRRTRFFLRQSAFGLNSRVPPLHAGQASA